MKKWLLFLLGVFIYFSSFSQGNLIWPDLSCATNNIVIGNTLCEDFVTNTNATIAIQTEAFSNITLEGAANSNIPAGAYIGVFYNDGGSYSCGGFSEWSGENENFVITAYGNDFLAPGSQDGFFIGEEYTWFLRINNSDNPLDGWTDYIGENMNMDTGVYTCAEDNCFYQENFAENGLSNLLNVDFVLYAEWSNCMDISACNYNQAVANNISDFNQDFIISALDQCEYPANEWLNCSGGCANDEDGDGVCNEFEISGCQNENAVNYNSTATDSYYNSDPSQPVSCYFIGCTDPDALNYDPNANASGPCDYPVYQLNWNFNDTGTNATFAITAINGIPGYEFTMDETFCSAVTVGAFYPSSSYNISDGYVESEEGGYSNGSSWTCIPELASYPYITIYGDDTYTSVVDGFYPNQSLILVLEVDGQEYLVEPTLTWIEGMTLPYADFVTNGLYIAELDVIEPVLFGCTDMNYVDYWEYDVTSGSISAPVEIPNFQDPLACTTDIVVGCMDPAAANFVPLANVNPSVLDSDMMLLMVDNIVNESCSYYGCTDNNYLEYFNYDPINYSISELNPLPDLDDDSCNTLIIYGCTDVTAYNYNSSANVDDESCVPIIEGCTDETAFNYDPTLNPPANTDYEGTLCTPFIYGCMDGGLTENGDGLVAYNYDPFANTDDNSCYYNPGCMDEEAFNYDPLVDFDDGTCIEIIYGCTNPEAFNYDDTEPIPNVDDGTCIPVIYGCTDVTSFNYSENANTNVVSELDESDPCIPFIYGCTDPTAFNYSENANTNTVSELDESDPCILFIYGCMDSTACNYDSTANTENGLCWYADDYYDCDGICLNDADGDSVCDELEISGCTDPTAFNYDSIATDDDGDCVPVIEGCNSENAYNYNPAANTLDVNNPCCFVSGCMDTNSINYNPNACSEDYSCIAVVLGCTDPSASNYDSTANTDDDSCIPFIYGCTNPLAFNYNASANEDFDGLLCIPVIYGCTDPEDFNYAVNANTDDGSCIPVVEGCLDETAFNYNADLDPPVNTDDGSCIPVIVGCLDPEALNYFPIANTDSGACFYLIPGCTNPNAYNYDPVANITDGSCVPFIYGCMDDTAFNYNLDANTNSVSSTDDSDPCVPVILGCTSPYYINYDPNANTDDGSCIPFIYGCTDPSASNYNELANTDFGGFLCTFSIYGCTDETAFNYDSALDPPANTDDGSCIPVVEGCLDETAFNYNADLDPPVNTDDGSCEEIILGCTNPISYNYNPEANTLDVNNPCCLIGGCMDESAFNFNSNACYDDGFYCIAVVEGCTDVTAFNYNSLANTDDDSCQPIIYGCTDPNALNYECNGDCPGANIDFGGLLCIEVIEGCTDPTMSNYDIDATSDDGSCIPYVFGCTDSTMYNYDIDANEDFDGALCEPFIYGCTELFAFNYDPNANTDDDSCQPIIFGCTDPNASNFECNGDCPGANIDFGGLLCSYVVLGCTNPSASNYDSTANTDDGSCCLIGGCMDEEAFNYNANACFEDDSCIPVVEGCMDEIAYNYNDYDGDGEPNPLTEDPHIDVNTDNGSCLAVVLGCTDLDAFNYNAFANTDDNSCITVILGCTDVTAFNYDENANTDDGSCIAVVLGCTDVTAFNFDSNLDPPANTDDGGCIAVVLGCTDENATNYNPNANTGDGSCIIYGCTDPDAENYDSSYTDDDGSCIIYGCIWTYWFICPESYDPNATVGDWSLCQLVFSGCESTAIELPQQGAYPTLLLSDIAENVEDIYYYLGEDKIGCMDRFASNYSMSAVLDDGSCLTSVNISNTLFSIYPQPAQDQISIAINNFEDFTIGSVLEIKNIIGETVLSKNISTDLNLIDISVPDLTPGVYFVLLDLNKQLVTKRFIIE